MDDGNSYRRIAVLSASSPSCRSLTLRLLSPRHLPVLHFQVWKQCRHDFCVCWVLRMVESTNPSSSLSHLPRGMEIQRMKLENSTSVDEVS
ncbi:hypothetical protein Nepgr_019416 [Nepenthes gracilis]|uniref:Uncharacterized protein n=1 Tax=Nepenthes gracilis TaxID=150966 RepID=A0AAD3SV40_NEPGR|nr:hypothetical protein Nepgr_019416 [Nepenthes gracilis]